MAYALSVLKHLNLPSGARLSSIFLSVYNWRTFFAFIRPGLRGNGQGERAFIRSSAAVRAAPDAAYDHYTSFALTAIGLWTGSIIFGEAVFNWPATIAVIYQAINLYDTPVIVGTTVINLRDLLGITVFFLDVDWPRPIQR